MKGFLVAALLIGGFVFFIYQNDPKRAGMGGVGKLLTTQANGKVNEVDSSNYESTVVSSEDPVLAYFWAPW